MSVIIAGGAGFIGINFIRKIIQYQSEIHVLDNFSNSERKWFEFFDIERKINIINCDLSNEEETSKVFNSICQKLTSQPKVWHFAANSDIEKGLKNPRIDLQNTFMTTFNLLENCKKHKINSFYFASSSAIYGDHKNSYLKESSGPLMPISSYGAMKLASESICFSSLESFLSDLRIFRFPNVVGSPATHGVIFDFIKKLIANPKELKVLGNGLQKKSYLHVNDLLDGMIYLANLELNQDCNPIFNLGSNGDLVSVKWIAEETVNIISPNAKIIYGKEDRGWLGDVPCFAYNTEKSKLAGWTPSLNSKEAILKAIGEISMQLSL